MPGVVRRNARKKNDVADCAMAGEEGVSTSKLESTLMYDQTDCSLMFIYILRLIRPSVFVEGKERNEGCRGW